MKTSSALSNRRRDRLFGVAITAPAIILLAVLFLYPIIYSLIISFTNYNYVRGTMKFVALKNYIDAFSDPAFLNSLKVTFVISIASVAIQLVFGIMLAMFVMNIRNGHGFFKSVFLIPMMIAPTVAGLLWRFMLNNEFGVINTALNVIGLPSVPWLVDLRIVLACVVVVDSWTCIPFVFLLMFTALTSVPQDMLEAGRIDGGNSWKIFIRIQLPTIRSALMVTLVLRFMDVFRIYDSIYLMTKGGPGNATEALSLYIYRVNWNKYMMGKASSMSYIMMIIMTIVGLVFQFYSKDKYDRREDKKMKNSNKEVAMQMNRNSRYYASKTLIYITLIIFFLFFIFPIFWLMLTSLKPRPEVLSTNLPSAFTLDSYLGVFREYNFAKYFPNTLIVSIASTLLVTLVAVPGAYGFCKYVYKGSKQIFTICVLLRMIPFISLMVPLYIYLSKLNLINTKTALIIANVTFNLPLSLWIMESYFRELPDELIEAASIDGAGRFRTMIKIAVPIALPSIATVIILAFLTTWKEYMFAFVNSATDASKTITVGISMLTQDYGSRWDLMSAAGSVCIAPVLVIAICFQKYIIKGMTLGAVKG